MKTQPLVKVSVFLLLLILAHGAISVLFPPSLPPEILEFDRHLEEGVDLLYFGNSTLMLPRGEVTTGEILQEMLPDRRVGQVAHPAYGLDLFYDYTAYIARHGDWPSTLVLPVNIRSFSPEWDMRPAYQFEKESRILTLGLSLTRLLLRPLDVFGFFQPTISSQDFLESPVYDGDVVVGRVREFEALKASESLQGDTGNVYRQVSLEDDDTAEAILTYHYMFSLQPDHRKLDSMIKLAELADEHDVEVILYISPVNVAQGERFLGDAFAERFTDNVGVVQSRLDAASLDNVTLLNLAFDLRAYNFIDMEHLTEAGKEYIADQIAQAIATDATSSASATPVATPIPTRYPTFPTLIRPPAYKTNEPTGTPSATPLPTSPAALLSTSTPTPSPTPSVTPTPTAVVPPTVTGGDVTALRYIQRYWPSGPYPVDLYRITFETVDEFDEIVETQADLYVPFVEDEAAFPILGHAAGTTGIGNGCSPLEERTTGRSWGGYHAQSLAYAAQGYIVVFPNWLHFDDPQRIHRYFISDLQGQTLLDAMRAAYGVWQLDQELDTEAQPAQSAFMMGYSSGGHAIFAAKDRAQAYAPELPIKGVLGFGAVTDPELLLKEDPIFGPYIVQAYRAFYGEEIIDPAEVYLPKWVPDFEDDALSTCVDEIFRFYSHSARRMYLPEFRQVLYNDRLADEFPQFAARLDENTAGRAGGTEIPVLILQGTADTVITPPSQRRFIDQLCALGNSVTVSEYQAASHAQTRARGYRDALAWMESAAQGNIPSSDCPTSD